MIFDILEKEKLLPICVWDVDINKDSVEYVTVLVFRVGGAWLYSIILVLCLFVLRLTLVQIVTLFPILIWQKWTKYQTKIVIHGNLGLTKVTPKGITNRSTLKVHGCQIEFKMKLICVSKTGYKIPQPLSP